MQKTRLMRAAEERAGKPLEQALPELLNALGRDQTAGKLRVGLPTINYWLLKFSITWKTVYMPPGYHIELVKDVDVAQLGKEEVAA